MQNKGIPFFSLKISLILFLRDYFFTDSSASILFHLNVAEEASKYFKVGPANIIGMSCEFSPFDLFFFKAVYSVLFANNIAFLNVKKNLMPDTCPRH